MEKIEMTGRMKQKTTTFLQARIKIDALLTEYLQGCMDGLGLEGNWNFDTNTLSFQKRNDPEKQEVKP